MKKIFIFSILFIFIFTTTTILLSWDKRYDGKPDKTIFSKKMHARYVIWQDNGVFKLRTTTEKILRVYRGRIVAVDGTFSDVNIVKAEGKDRVHVSADKKIIYFHFETDKGIDGLNFKTNGKKIGLALFLSDKTGNEYRKAKTEEIFIGKKGVNPKNNPFGFDLTDKTGEDSNINLNINVNDDVPKDAVQVTVSVDVELSL